MGLVADAVDIIAFAPVGCGNHWASRHSLTRPVDHLEVPLQTFDVMILTGEYWDERNKHEIRLYGRSDTIGAVELVFDDMPPVFFVDREETLPGIDVSFNQKALALRNFAGNPIDALYFRTQQDLQSAAERFRATGVPHFEADVRPHERFLMEKGIHTQARVRGEGYRNGPVTSFRNPMIKPSHHHPELVWASIDIETGAYNGQLYSIGAHISGRGRDEQQVFMLADRRQNDRQRKIAYFPSEPLLLQAFFKWFNKMDPDIIIGWHVIGFDLMFLENKCRDYNLELDITRSDRMPLLIEKPGAGYFATLSGRVVIDGPSAMRAAGFTFPNYKLETVAQEVLQTGKLITADGASKIEEINRQFREDKQALAKYNLEDCVLVTDIYRKTGLVDYMVARSRHSGVLLDQLGLPNAAFDHAYLPALHRKGYVAPNSPDSGGQVMAGGLTIFEAPGDYHQVVQLHFVNLYPSLIRIFKTEPLAQIRQEVEPLTTPAGFQFSSTEHILPAYLADLLTQRQQARDQGATQTLKALDMILANICRSLNHPGCRFFHRDLHQALGAACQWILDETRNLLADKGYQVVRVDDEDLFVALKEEQYEDPTTAANLIAQHLNDYWREKLAAEYGESHLELEVKNTFSRFILPIANNDNERVKQRYAAFIADGEGRLILYGLDAVLNQWTDLSKRFQREFFETYFRGRDLDGWLRDYNEQLKLGAFNHEMVYERRIRKALDEYSRTSPPPHIKAARLLGKASKSIRYVYTKRGPYPVELNPTDIDLDHYVNRQLTPVAATLLALSEQTLTDITEPKQMGLF